MDAPHLILAPLRGVTIRCFRRVFADAIRAAGFAEAVTPFITANAGVDPLRDRELRPPPAEAPDPPLRVTPQFIGKDPAALAACLARVKAAGFATADLNCGCPFPMVRNKGRGSGLLRTPDVLCRMLEAGCTVMGPGRFSVKARLGVSRPDELLALLPRLNAAASTNPVVPNGDIPLPDAPPGRSLMIGRAFLRSLADRADIGALLDRYVAASRAELGGERPVLGRIKELLAYWKDLPRWRRRWQVAKLARTLDELRVW